MAYYSGSVDYEEGFPLGGNLVSQSKTAAADTYYIGMPLAYNDTNDNYEYSATAPEIISMEAKTLSAEGSLLCAVSGTEWLQSGIVDDSGAALTLTDDFIHTALTNGLVLR